MFRWPTSKQYSYKEKGKGQKRGGGFVEKAWNYTMQMSECDLEGHFSFFLRWELIYKKYSQFGPTQILIHIKVF